MPLVSLARARYHPEADQVSDDLLTYALEAAEDKVLQLVGQSIGLAEHTDVLNGTDNYRVWLSQLPVTSITSMTFIDMTEAGVADTEVDVDVTTLDYDPKTGEVRFARGTIDYFPLGWRNIEVVYNAGLADDEVPEAVKEAIIVLALSLVEVMGTSNVLALGAEAGDYATGLREAANQNMPPLILQLLKDYMVPGVTIHG